MKSMFAMYFMLAMSLQAKATPEAQGCDALKQIQMKMDVVASNIANTNTTRTPDGGPYLFKSLSCKANICDIQSDQKIKYVYEPEHPDAREGGYVAYPDINVEDQIAEMKRLSIDYDNAAQSCL